MADKTVKFRVEGCNASKEMVTHRIVTATYPSAGFAGNDLSDARLKTAISNQFSKVTFTETDEDEYWGVNSITINTIDNSSDPIVWVKIVHPIQIFE